jgi:hypothetical protein
MTCCIPCISLTYFYVDSQYTISRDKVTSKGVTNIVESNGRTEKMKQTAMLTLLLAQT